MQLVIGNKNYSSWSLRPWALLSHFNIPFEEINESLNGDDLSQRLAEYSPSRKVPVLVDGEICIWDSLAICEYINEYYLHGKGWPLDKQMKAHARAITAEMHSSFAALRNALPMNCRAQRFVALTSEVQQEIDYIDNMWATCLKRYGGEWLFKEFSIADCFYAPVVMRFSTYGIELSPQAEAYANHVHQSDAMQRWVKAACNESEVVPVDEAGEDRR